MPQALRISFVALLLPALALSPRGGLAQTILKSGFVSSGSSSGVSGATRLSGSLATAPHGEGQNSDYSLQFGFWAQIRPASTVDVTLDPDGPPREVSLGPAWPNPASDAIHLHLVVPRSADVRARLYDISGRIVADLLEEHLQAGEHDLSLRTARLPTGFYITRVELEGRTFSRRVVIVR